MRLDLNGKKNQKIGFSFAWNGIQEVFKTERNFRIHIFAALLVIVTGFLLKITRYEWLAICLTMAFVLVSEALNSAIEKTIDYISPNIHPAAKQIKDIAAGAVLIAAIAAVIVGIIVFLPRLYHVFI